MKLLLLVSFLSLWRRSDGTGAALINMVVKEGNDAILPCSISSRNIRQDLFDWKKDKKDVFMYDQGTVHDEYEQFRGRVSHFPDDLEVGNASIRIRATKLTDSGSYTCDFPRLPPERRSNIVLVVDPILKDRSDENISGAAPDPVIKILGETKEGVQLQCSVRGVSPKPEVQWKNRAGDLVPAEEPQVSERGGSYDIILQTTVTKTDHYRCVSTQKEIDHQTHAETYVPVPGAAPELNITRLGETKEGVQLQCSVRGASPKPKVFWLDGDKNLVPAEEPQVSERGGSYDIILQTTVTKTDNYRCVAKQEIDHQTQTHADKYVIVPGSDANAGGTVPVGVVVSAVVGAVLLALLVGVVVGGFVVYFVQKKKTHSAVPTNTV